MQKAVSAHLQSEQILHFGLHGTRPIIGSNVGSIVDMSGDPPFIARRVNRMPLSPDLLPSLVSGFDNKNTVIQCFNSGPASQTVAQYWTNIVYLVWTVENFQNNSFNSFQTEKVESMLFYVGIASRIVIQH